MFIHIFIWVAPRFTNVTGINDVIANGVNTVRLTCRTDSANPPSTITWYRNGQQVASSSTARHEAGDCWGQVTIQDLEFKARRELNGQVVECRSSNGLPSGDSGTFILNIRCKWTVQIHTVVCFIPRDMYSYCVMAINLLRCMLCRCTRIVDDWCSNHGNIFGVPKLHCIQQPGVHNHVETTR